MRPPARQGARDLHADRDARQSHGGARAGRGNEPRPRPGGQPLLPRRRRLRPDAQQPDAHAAGAGPRRLHRRRGQQLLDQTKGARVVSRVSVLAVETPVRRKQGEHVDAASSTGSSRSRSARASGAAGCARLFLQAAYTGEMSSSTPGRSTRSTFRLQVLQRRAGAILAGARVMTGCYARRMFGRVEHAMAVRGRGAALPRRLQPPLRVCRHIWGRRASARRRRRGGCIA